MRAIKFAQWTSSVAIALIIMWILGISTWLIVADKAEVIAKVISVATVLALFVAPEKAAAFFGPVIKRKQQNGSSPDPPPPDGAPEEAGG